MQRYLKPEVIKEIARLDLRARFIVEGFLTGMHGSWRHGFSVEFSEYRRYIPGDDPRFIDWGVYARTDRHYVKLFQAETTLEGYLALDLSASMDYGSGALTKLDYSICLAAALGFLMVNQKDSVGLFTFDEKPRSIFPPRSKQLHLMRILGELASSKPGGRTSFFENMKRLAAFARHRSLMMIFSDLLLPLEEVTEGLSLLRHIGHDVIVFHVLDRAEREFPFGEPHVMEDPETGRKLSVAPELVREGYLAELQRFCKALERECASLKIDFVPIDTSTPFDKALTSFLVKRARR